MKFLPLLLNFIIKLFINSKNDKKLYDVILIIINYYIKIKLFKFIIQDFIVIKLVYMLYKNIKYRFNFFIYIISDKKKLFIN